MGQSLLLLCAVLSHTGVLAQSLSVRLRAESPASLAHAARERGNAVRGAILFTGRNLACSQCHVTGDSDLLGPDLTRLGSDVTDDYLVQALLNPSAVIRKGFESAAVLTTSGDVISGRIVNQTSDGLQIRVLSGNRELVTLTSEDVDRIAASNDSAMPDNLVDQLKDRGQFLDLLRYTMELVATGESSSRMSQLAGGESISTELQGIVLLREFNCRACHRDQAPHDALSDKRAPDLAWASGRIDPNYIEQFIANPHHIKPGTTMPNLMSSLSREERKLAAKQITHYLMALKDRSFIAQPIDREASVRGGELFHSVGCVACHSPRDNQGRELLTDASVSLEAIEQKYNTAGLVDFLKNPLEVRPSGRMPQMRLTHWEAVDLANYLLNKPTSSDQQLSDDQQVDQTFQPDPSLAEKGKARFQQLGCQACHQTDSTFTSINASPLSQLDPQRGCLSASDGDWPSFALTTFQREAIATALGRTSGTLSQRDQIAVSLTAFRCLNCHSRNELGGVTAERNPHFQTTNPNLGPQGRIPPTLTNAGAKLKRDWMRGVLVGGRAIRPYMLTRMPQYGAENVEHLVPLLQQADQLSPLESVEFQDLKETRKIGAELVGTGGLSCIACHTFQLQKAANMPAVDLTEMAERLKRDWFHHYMRDPQRFSLNTVMPSFWPGGNAMRKDIFDGDTNRQIEAIWQYLLEGRQARTPRGLLREPLELLASDEAVMLRRSYRGIGKRGIGVGYPNQVNLVFDAEQMRLAMLWKGGFADAGGVWRGQGHGTVRPLGEEVIRFAPGPDLDDHETPWPVDEGRPPNHQFQGYSLDEKMRPALRYRFAGIDVEDYSIDVVDPSTQDSFLRRKITMKSESSHRGTLRFRAATGESVAKIDDDTFLVDNQLRIHLDENCSGEIVDGPNSQQLCIPVKVDAGGLAMVIEYKW